MKILWMKVSEDKYELPIAVAESSAKLGEMLGVKSSTIRSCVKNAEINGWKTVYCRVVIDDEY